MMKKITLILTILFVHVGLNAQIFDKLGKKLEKKVEDRINRKVDKSMDKTLDKTEDKIDKTVSGDKKSNEESEEYETQTEVSSPSGMFGGFGKQVDIEDVYDFDIDLIFEMTTTTAKSTNEMKYLLGIKEKENEHVYMEVLDVIEDGKTQKMEKTISMIFDANNKAMITILPEDKMVMPMSMDLDYMLEDDEPNVSDEYTMNKTGKKKDILGYSCEEYEMESEEMEGTAWVSTDTRLKHFNPFSAMGNMAKSSRNKESNSLDFNGPVLEMDMIFKEAEKKNDPQNVTYKVTDIKKVSRKIDISGYSNPMDFKR